MISPKQNNAFTLIELLTVIAIIAVLMGLLFPAIGSVKESAKKTQAKNDEAQIVTAIKAYYTEYGKYPPGSATVSGSAADISILPEHPAHPPASTGNHFIMDILRNNTTSSSGSASVILYNPRGVVFIDAPLAKNATTAPINGVDASGDYYDPWGSTYGLMIDGDYDGQILRPPYTSGAGQVPLNTGVIVDSFGKDHAGCNGIYGAGQSADDVISWQ